MLPASPGILPDTLLFADLKQFLELLFRLDRVSVRLITWVEAYLMPPFMDLSQHLAEEGVIYGIVAIEFRISAGSLEIEGALQSVLFADIHYSVEGVVGVALEVSTPCRYPVADPFESSCRMSPTPIRWV